MRFAVPHRPKGLFGAFHGKGLTDLGLDPRADEATEQVLHVLKRTHDRSTHGELLAQHGQERQRHVQAGRAPSDHDGPATSNRPQRWPPG